MFTDIGQDLDERDIKIRSLKEQLKIATELILEERELRIKAENRVILLEQSKKLDALIRGEE